MVLVTGMDLPPGYQELLDKILAYFDNSIYPTWASRYFHHTRAAKKANQAKTYMPSISAAWKLLSPAEKAAWGTAADFGTLNNYQLFTSDFSYRYKNGLTVPGTPNDYHQLFGMRIQNPSGSSTVQFRRDEKELVGPVTIQFNYQKTENAPTGGDPFRYTATLYYFWAGKNLTLTDTWEAPSGNVSWNTIQRSFGTSGQKYFHLTLEFEMSNYDAIVDLDCLLIQDQSTNLYLEDWQYKSGKTWEYDNLYRKRGWYFVPAYREPFFNVIYLE